MLIRTFISVAAALAVVPRSSHGVPLDARADEPCKQLRDAVDKWFKDNNIVLRTPANIIEETLIPSAPAAQVKPSIAYACLQSVPLDKETALQQIDYLKPQFEWQSSVEYLKNPPKGYLSEGVDLLGGLDDIAAKLKEDAYKNEFAFLVDLHTLSNIRVRDFHFTATNTLMWLFTFRMGVKFMSVSKDGLALPEIFLHEDVEHDKNGYKPSPVSTIDGEPAMEYLMKASTRVGGAHDPDARFNWLFPSVAKEASLTTSGADIYITGGLTDTTKVAFENKTVREFDNIAYVRANLTNITSAADLYRDFGLGKGKLPMAWNLWEWYEKNYTTTLAGYPKPTNRTLGGDGAGFLVDNDKDLKDVAVLTVNSFNPVLNPLNLLANLNVDYALWNVTTDFIKTAKAQGRSKLILDMQGNGGGRSTAMMALYLALFPEKVLPLLWQARAHPQLEWLVAEFDKQQQQNGTNSTATVRWPWVFRDPYIRPNSTQYKSFSEFYGPVKGPSGGDFTHASLLNVTASLTNTFYPVVPKPWATPPFAPKDITILTDGYCGSACAIFVEILTHAHGIRTVTVGGRPQYAPMQAIGSIKGGPVVSFLGFDTATKNFSAPPPTLTLPDAKPPPLMMLSEEDKGTRGASFNQMNILPMGADERTDVPLQFVYEAAHCRVFYTWEMARDITALWRVVARAAWGNGKCVEGSTPEKGGMMGDKVLGHSKEVEDRFGLGKGPGSLKK